MLPAQIRVNSLSRQDRLSPVSGSLTWTWGGQGYQAVVSRALEDI